MIRILLVDDHPVVRQGLRGMLVADDLEVVGDAGSGQEAIAQAALLKPDVVLMDLRMPEMDGVAATARIVGTGPRVLVLTTYETDSDILRAVEAGASGYLLKDSTTEDLIAAVRAASRGETVLAPSMVAKVVGQVRTPPLSAREAEVLKLVAKGLSNVEIGRTLFISEATVKTHLLRVFNKLGVSDRTAAVTTAMDRGMLQ